MREEARVGQRTTLDVLNAQQALVNARVNIVTAQHDRVVASYAVLAAIGRLSPQVLGLGTTVYDPSVHYHRFATPGPACGRRTATELRHASAGRCAHVRVRIRRIVGVVSTAVCLHSIVGVS